MATAVTNKENEDNKDNKDNKRIYLILWKYAISSRVMDKKIERIINFLYDKTGHDTLVVIETLSETKDILDIIEEVGGFRCTVKLHIGDNTYLYNANETRLKTIHVLQSQDEYRPEEGPCDLIISWKYDNQYLV